MTSLRDVRCHIGKDRNGISDLDEFFSNQKACTVFWSIVLKAFLKSVILIWT